MEYPILMHDREVGTCVLEEVGLYWQLRCDCELLSDRVERLYAGERRLGVFEKEGDRLTLRRVISKASCPELPPQNGVLTLHPVQPPEPEPEEPALEPWEGEVQGYPLKGYLKDDRVLFPYDENEPCPCEPLICFFEVKDGFWQLPLSAGE
ncbi:MAG: hypothetical protein IJO88_07705 [Oscillospiraceae bacterium]|nr:hypothetical protein [Oscillospiraceae bacterium]